VKIVFLLQSFPCLSETFILNQITGLIDLGCEVRIIAFGKSGETKQHPDVARYRLLDKTIYIQPPKSKLACRLKAAIQTLSGFMRHPFMVYRFQKKLLAEGRSCFYPKLFMALAAIRQGADIIHCHYGTVGRAAIVLKDIGLGSKISTVFHGYDLSMYLNEHGFEVYQELFAKGDIFLPVSEFWKQKLIDIGCPAKKTIVHHMGIDTAIFKPGIRGKDSERTKILTVARLTEKKGHRYALEAIRRVLGVFPQLEYHIAGDGPLFDEMKQLTREWGFENHVVFHGKVDAEEAMELYENADIFLLPSVTSSEGDMEGIPVSLMEAMACGLPVISTMHSGIPELVANGQAGYLVPERDVDALAAAIQKLLERSGLWPKMGRIGRVFVERNYEIKELNEKLIGIYKEIVRKRSNKRSPS
jgi:colanic acid/amylovoran biosynthesis glycosyltransferase